MVNEANERERERGKKRGMTNPAVFKRSNINNTNFPLQVSFIKSLHVFFLLYHLSPTAKEQSSDLGKKCKHLYYGTRENITEMLWLG